MKETEKLATRLQETVLHSTQESPTEKVVLEPYLVILSGHDQGKQFHLHRQHNSFGRTSDVDIVIADAKISRKHGAFIIYPEYIVLEDYQSTNGSYVDGLQVERQVLELSARIKVGNTLMKIEYKNAHEAAAEKALHVAANTDALTNISNRRAFMAKAQEEFSFCQQNDKFFTIIMYDVDHFKRINDNLGHPAGDQVLKELAEILQAQIRREDLLARYGGEEFIMLLRGTDADSASKWAERIRKKVEQFNFSIQDEFKPVTLSIGVCCRKGEQITTLEAIIQQADNGLYQAKNNGRNRVEMV
jgi:diguanylate cyclase (GGDEF)-like protein